MHRSSKTIGAIAAALAKAQAELTNPEKLLTATIRPASRIRNFSGTAGLAQGGRPAAQFARSTPDFIGASAS
jgi:hypothetical protein